MTDEKTPDETTETPKATKKRVDESWKARAAKERGKLETEVEEQQGTPGSGAEPKAHPLWPQFLNSLAAQALMLLGQEPDPMTGQRHVDLQQARFTIDLIGMIREKTAGNVTVEERQMIDQLHSQLQMAFVEIQRQASQAAPPEPGGDSPVSSQP